MKLLSLGLLIGIMLTGCSSPPPPRLAGPLTAVPVATLVKNYGLWVAHSRYNKLENDDALYMITLKSQLVEDLAETDADRQALRECRVENGMDSQQVIVAWGMPYRTEPAETSPWGRVDRWSWGHPHYDPPRGVTMRNGIVVWWHDRE